MDGYTEVLSFKEHKVISKSTFKKPFFYKCSRCAFCCKNTQIELQDAESVKFENKNITNKNGYQYLAKKNNIDCVFLDKNSCSIYDSRPIVCREFPFKINIVNDVVYVDAIYSCPGTLIPSKSDELDFKELVSALIGNISELPHYYFDFSLLISAWKDKISGRKERFYGRNNDWEAFVGKAIQAFQRNKLVLHGFEASTGKIYSMHLTQDWIVIEYNDESRMKNLNLLKIKDKTKIAISKSNEYMLTAWDRKTPQIDVHYYSKFYNISPNIIFTEACNRMEALHELMLHLVAIKNSHDKIEESDCLEAMWLSDQFFLLPARLIAPKSLNKKKAKG